MRKTPIKNIFCALKKITNTFLTFTGQKRQNFVVVFNKYV